MPLARWSFFDPSDAADEETPPEPARPFPRPNLQGCRQLAPRSDNSYIFKRSAFNNATERFSSIR